MKLEHGQVAVVTGGAGGIGWGMARAFAARGLHVVLADIDAASLAAARAELEAADVEVLDVVTDVRRPEQVDALADATLARFGRVDIVCNNAGVVTPRKPLWAVDEREWDWVLSVNLRGVISGMRAFVPHLITRGTGHVVNTASMAGLATLPMLGPYTAAKHAVVALSESLAVELAGVAPGVGVTVLCPGLVESNLGRPGRNRPPGITPDEPSAHDAPTRLPAGLVALPALAVGEAVVEAIEANRLHIAPNGSLSLVRERVERLLTDLS